MKYLVFTALLFAFNNSYALTCATNEAIQNLSVEEAIDLAYKSGPSAGNFGFESPPLDGLIYQSKENAHGNKDILDLYPTLNKDVLKVKDNKEWPEDHRNQYAGIYQPTYFQAQECRRQILITDVKTEGNEKYFVGWINVELCDPSVKKAFEGAAAYFEAKGEKLDSIHKLIAAVKAQNAPLGARLDEALFTDDPGVYYPKMANGHIAPRYSLRIKKMTFANEHIWSGEKSPDDCLMTTVPTSPYAGVLEIEQHNFSDGTQESLSGDPFTIPYFNEKGESVGAEYPVNGKLNETK